jgi:hypothetical protein
MHAEAWELSQIDAMKKAEDIQRHNVLQYTLDDY